MELTMVNLELKNKLQIRIRSARGSLHCRLEDSLAVETGKDARVRLMIGRNTLAQDRGNRLFEHTRNQGEQVETLWEGQGQGT